VSPFLFFLARVQKEALFFGENLRRKKRKGWSESYEKSCSAIYTREDRCWPLTPGTRATTGSNICRRENTSSSDFMQKNLLQKFCLRDSRDALFCFFALVSKALKIGKAPKESLSPPPLSPMHQG